MAPGVAGGAAWPPGAAPGTGGFLRPRAAVLRRLVQAPAGPVGPLGLTFRDAVGARGWVNPWPGALVGKDALLGRHSRSASSSFFFSSQRFSMTPYVWPNKPFGSTGMSRSWVFSLRERLDRFSHLASEPWPCRTLGQHSCEGAGTGPSRRTAHPTGLGWVTLTYRPPALPGSSDDVLSALTVVAIAL